MICRAVIASPVQDIFSYGHALKPALLGAMLMRDISASSTLLLCTSAVRAAPVNNGVRRGNLLLYNCTFLVIL